MHIGIDVRMYGTYHRGIGRYVEQLVLGLAKKQDGNRYTLFATTESKALLPKLPGKFRVMITDVPWYSISEQIHMPRFIKESGVDMVHWPHLNVPFFCPVPFMVTIHDLIVYHFPDSRATTRTGLLYALKLKAYHKVLKHAITKAQRIISVSEFTKQDILDHFQVDPEKIKVTHLGVDQFVLGTGVLANSKKLSTKIQEQFHITQPYIMYVGAAYPHKNVETLLRAFTQVRKTYKDEYQLVLVGRHDFFYKNIKRAIKKLPISVQKSIILTGEVSEKELDELYRNASLFVFPSLYEGFGLPPLEAMARGVPVLSSNAASMPEVLGKAAVYINPHSEKDIAESVHELLHDAEAQTWLRTKGLEQVKQYTWKKMVDQITEIYATEK